MAVNCSLGVAVCPLLLWPQQVMVPSACRPQVWAQPAVMAVNGLAGAVSCRAQL